MLNLPGLVVGNTLDGESQYELEVTVEGGEPTCGCTFPKLLLNGRKRTMFFDTH